MDFVDLRFDLEESDLFFVGLESRFLECECDDLDFECDDDPDIECDNDPDFNDLDLRSEDALDDLGFVFVFIVCALLVFVFIDCVLLVCLVSASRSDSIERMSSSWSILVDYSVWILS